MSLCSDLRMLYAILLAPITGETHAERLESFYARQAEGYDAFRQRLLHGRRLLKPGGCIGVVDFYVSRKHPEPGQVRHAWLTRTFWPIWFGTDNVYPSPDHVPYLHHRFEAQHFSEHRGTMPYVPGARVPYYMFVGRKPARSEGAAAGGGI
jgi:hypothetical protein